MGDLIDRQAVINAFKNATADGDKFEWCEWVLKQLPTVDPYKHGEWLPVPKNRLLRTSWYCSECGNGVEIKDQFCSNCGAKMDLEEKND